MKSSVIPKILLAPGALLAGLASLPAQAQSLSSITDTFDQNLPGSAFGWVLRDAHLENPVEVVDFQLMEAIDWIIPNNADAFGPGVFDRMETSTPRISALEPTGFIKSGAHHQWDAQIVPFVFNNAELIGPSPEEGFWATSWIGDESGGGATWIFRVEVGADSLQIWHWWNHGLADRQTVTARLFNAAGQVLLEHVVMVHQTTIFRQYTSIIDVTGTADGDYLLIEHVGTNVGWRGSAVLAGSDTGGPIDPPPPFGRFAGFPMEDGFADTGDWLGLVFVEPHPWIYSPYLGTWALEASGWLYLFNMAEAGIVDLSTDTAGGAPGWIYVPAVDGFAFRYGDWFYFID